MKFVLRDKANSFKARLLLSDKIVRSVEGMGLDEPGDLVFFHKGI